jgi:ferredoxin-like protein FixX
MVASTSAFAETLTAKIDFPFRAGSTIYPAAEYEVQVITQSGGPIVRISNPSTNQSRLLMPMPTDTYVKAGESKLVFNCTGGADCSLAQVWSPRGLRWSFHQPKSTSADLERMAVVTVPLQIARTRK